MKKYLLQTLYDIFQIPLIWWDVKEQFQIPDKEIYQSPFINDNVLKDEVEAICKANDLPVLYLENDQIFYGVFRDEHNRIYCIGPVSRNPVNKLWVEKYKKEHQVVMPLEIRQSSMGLMTKLVVMIYSLCTGKQIKYSDVSVKSNDKYIEQWTSEENLEDYRLQQSENDRGHGKGMAFEYQLMEIVKAGDVEAMKSIMSGRNPEVSDIGEFSSDNHRQMEYMVVTILALLTRAAVEGGMNPEEAYILGDVYIRKIEQCSNDTAALTMLGLKAQFEFTEKVKEAKEKKSQFIYVERCKDYIAKNLKKNIKISDIAPALGISKTYLTHKFTETEGMSIQQYILKERCEHAANLLKYSDYPISVISEYFCFASQSHFGSSFKKQFGMTPREYRSLYGRVLDTPN